MGLRCNVWPDVCKWLRESASAMSWHPQRLFFRTSLALKQPQWTTKQVAMSLHPCCRYEQQGKPVPLLREHPRSFRAPLVPHPGLHVFGWTALEDDGLGAGDVRMPQLPSPADAPELGHTQVRREVARNGRGSAVAAA